MSLQGILAATDFSVRSERALQRAALLSRQFSAQLQLLHVVDGDQPAELVALEAAEASALLERNAAALRQAAGAAPSARALHGDTFPSIPGAPRSCPAGPAAQGRSEAPPRGNARVRP